MEALEIPKPSNYFCLAILYLREADHLKKTLSIEHNIARDIELMELVSTFC